MDKLDLVIDIIRGMSVKQDETSKDISDMKIDVALNKEDLKDHMAQTIEARKLTLAIEKKLNERLEHVENKLTVAHLLKLIGTVTVATGSIAGAIYGVVKVIDFLSK